MSDNATTDIDVHDVALFRRPLRLAEWEDFARYAELCGARGIGVERRDQLDHAFGEMFTTPGPVTVRVRADPELV